MQCNAIHAYLDVNGSSTVKLVCFLEEVACLAELGHALQDAAALEEERLAAEFRRQHSASM